MRWAGYVPRMEEGRSDFKMFTGKSRGKRPLGRPRRRWEDPCECGIEPLGSISHGVIVDINIDSIFQIMFRR